MQPTVDVSVETQGRGDPHRKLNKYSTVGLSSSSRFLSNVLAKTTWPYSLQIVFHESRVSSRLDKQDIFLQM